MSFPPPPGLPPRPVSGQSQSAASLPPRPPVTAATTSTATTGAGSRTYSAFTSFQPRSVAASQPFRTASPVVSSPHTPVGGYSSPTPQPPAISAAPTYSSGYQYQQPPSQYPPQQQQQQYGQNYYSQQNPPQIQNPFPAPNQATTYSASGTGRGYNRADALDPETEAQIAQWQSAYLGKDAEQAQTQPTGKGSQFQRQGPQSATGANTGPVANIQRFHDSSAGSTPTAGAQAAAPGAQQDPAKAGKTVIRSGGGQTWTDPTLLEWDPSHFRLFVGNLAGEVTDDSLLKAFSKYSSVQKARVIRDKRTEKSKGYGFVSFSDGDDYFRAAREMQGKYIGSHPVLLRRAMTEIRPVAAKSANNKGGKKGAGHGGGGGGSGNTAKKPSGAVNSGGIQKKQKTKGGLRVLG